MKLINRGETPMIARLFLVGMVAALGITFPSSEECQYWFGSFQQWASARLADWDTWTPQPDETRTAAAAHGPMRGRTIRVARRLASFSGERTGSGFLPETEASPSRGPTDERTSVEEPLLVSRLP